MSRVYEKQKGRRFPSSLFLFPVCCVLLAGILTGCSFFMTPQERSGINPKPFNSQASWESAPYRTLN